MIRFATDENLHGDIFREVLRHYPDLDIVRIQDTELYQSADPKLLEWLAEEKRLLLTHDAKTMPKYAYQRIDQSKYLPGVFIIIDRKSIGQVIASLLLIIGASSMEEWENRVVFLPF